MFGSLEPPLETSVTMLAACRQHGESEDASTGAHQTITENWIQDRSAAQNAPGPCVCRDTASRPAGQLVEGPRRHDRCAGRTAGRRHGETAYRKKKRQGSCARATVTSKVQSGAPAPVHVIAIVASPWPTAGTQRRCSPRGEALAACTERKQCIKVKKNFLLLWNAGNGYGAPRYRPPPRKPRGGVDHGGVRPQLHKRLVTCVLQGHAATITVEKLERR